MTSCAKAGQRGKKKTRSPMANGIGRLKSRGSEKLDRNFQLLGRRMFCRNQHPGQGIYAKVPKSRALTPAR